MRRFGAPLDPALIEAALSGKKLERKWSAFLKELKETLDVGDDGRWLADMARKKLSDEPFGDTGETVKRLQEAGASAADLGRLAAWSRYQACERMLALLKDAGVTPPDDTTGLHESFLTADPSGKEGRPGSWPIKTERKTGKKDADAPLWKCRSGQAIAFSPDGRFLAVGAASGPARIRDAATGEKLVVCEGVKAHIYRLAFSPDGSRVAVADQDKRVTICDVLTGKALAKATFPAAEISGLAYNPKTGELLRST